MTMEEYLARPLADRLERLRTTASELTAAIDGKSDTVLSRRPDHRNWSAKEIVCHLRDVDDNHLDQLERALDGRP